MGLSAGPVPSRVDACVKAGLLDLVDHAVDAGWSSRRAAARLGVDDSRLARWQQRRECGELTDRAPGGAPLHGLLAAERAAILTLFQTWGEIDRSHRKLAHRGSRLDLVHVSESTVLRVLAAEGIALPGNPRRDPIPRAPWPDWLEWKPNHIWAYDFTHFTRARRAAIAILDMVSRKWLTTLVAAEESSTQVEVAFTAALDAEGMSEAAESWASPELQEALNAGDDDRLAELTVAGQVPLLLAVSDNGPQMRSYSTREFMAALAIAQQFGRPSTPTDQAWIETLFGHVKGEWPHLEKIRDPGELERELDRVRARVQRCEVARVDRICDARRRTPGPRRGDPPSPPRRPGTGPPNPHRLPSSTTTGRAMRTRSLVVGYFHPIFLTNSDTPQRRPRSTGTPPMWRCTGATSRTRSTTIRGSGRTGRISRSGPKAV